MNWGQIGGWAGVALSAMSCIGYAFAGQPRQSVYFFFAACITTTVVWK